VAGKLLFSLVRGPTPSGQLRRASSSAGCLPRATGVTKPQAPYFSPRMYLAVLYDRHSCGRENERGASQTRCFRETTNPKSQMGVVHGNVAVEKPTHHLRVSHDDCVACDPCPHAFLKGGCLAEASHSVGHLILHSRSMRARKRIPHAPQKTCMMNGLYDCSNVCGFHNENGG
jgi:hypothetical protein